MCSPESSPEVCVSTAGRVLEEWSNDDAKLLSCIYMVETSAVITQRSIVYVVGMTKVR